MSLRPHRMIPALGAIVALLAGSAGCGDDDDGEPAGPGQPTTTTGPPGVGPGPGDPDPDRDLTALRCQAEPGEILDATRLEGLPVTQAEQRSERHGCSLRVVERDGEPLAVTDDFRPDRVNVAVEDGDVTAVVGAY